MQPYLTKKMANSFSYTQMQNVYTDTLVSVSVVEENPAYVVFTTDYKKNGTLLQGMIQLHGTGEWRVDSVAPPEK